MSVDQTKKVLRGLLVTASGLDLVAEAVPERGILDQLGIDSAAGMRFLIQVEQEFGFLIPDDELSLTLVDDLERLACYVQSRQSGR